MAGGNPVRKRITVLGASLGGLELSTMLSESFGDDVDVTLIATAARKPSSTGTAG